MTISRRIALTLGSLVICGASMAGVLDQPLAVAKRSQAYDRLDEIKERLSLQESFDLFRAIQAISMECSEKEMPNLTPEERDGLFVALIDKQSPRQIILMAGCLLQARYGEEWAATKARKLDHAEQEFLADRMSLAEYFPKEYLKPKEEANQPPQTPTSGTPAASASAKATADKGAPVAPPPGTAGR